MSTTSVSIFLLIVWTIFYIVLKRRMVSLKLYFVLLVFMASAGLIFHPLPLMGLYPDIYRFINIVLFSILMVLGIIPWLDFDKFLKRRFVIILNERYLFLIKLCFLISIICSFYAIIYSIPYSVISYSMGANNVRLLLDTGDTLMPQNVFTTLAIGFGAFSPVNIIFVFISLLDKRLKRYTLFLVISSTSYIVTTFASAARDGFILIPLTYIVFFIIFKASLSQKHIKLLKRYSIIVGSILAVGFSFITLDRFNSSDNTGYVTDDLIYGTWGYFYQQPYVFDHRIEEPIFYGFKRRLVFLDGMFGVDGQEYYKTESIAHQMFGTMYLEIYEIAGYSSLFIITFIYIILFLSIIKYHRRHRNIFPMLLAFCIYFYFTISGMFYFRFAGNTSEFLFYMMLLFSSFIIPNILRIKYND